MLGLMMRSRHAGRLAIVAAAALLLGLGAAALSGNLPF